MSAFAWLPAGCAKSTLAGRKAELTLALDPPDSHLSKLPHFSSTLCYGPPTAIKTDVSSFLSALSGTLVLITVWAVYRFTSTIVPLPGGGRILALADIRGDIKE